MAAMQTGSNVLARVIASNRVNVHLLDLEGFRAWLAERISEQEHDEIFRQKCLIRDIFRQNRRKIQRRIKTSDEARIAYLESTHCGTLEQLTRQIARLQKGVNGLTNAVNEGRADPQKLAQFEQALKQQWHSYSELVESCPEKPRLDRAEASLARLRDELGLTHEAARLKNLQRQRGRQTGTAGSRFEVTARAAIGQFIVPGLWAPGIQIECLRGVILGSARAEFDYLIVGVSPERTVVEVLAVVEAKRNVNDIARGFEIRQENLAWFTGDERGYDPSQYQTRVYSTGHFDRTVLHQQDGQVYAFDRRSFQRFRRDPETGKFLAGLYFVAGMRPLLGVSIAELARILHWVALDPAFDLTSDATIRRYRKRVLSSVSPLQTCAVLEIYLKRSLAGQVIFAA